MSDEIIVGYAPVRMRQWEDMEITPVGFPLRAPPGQVGYIPVYQTLEALRAEHGECSYMVIRGPAVRQ